MPLLRKLIDRFDKLFWVNSSSSDYAEEEESKQQRSILSQEDAEKELSSGGATRTINWGGLNLQENSSSGGYFLIGERECERSTLIQLLLQSVLPHLRLENAPGRALIYDPHTNWFPIISQINPQVPFHTLNPLSDKGHAWDISNDLKDPDEATRFSKALFPDPSSEAAREVSLGLIKALGALSNGDWSFRDLTLSMSSSATAAQVLSKHKPTKAISDQWLSGKENLEAYYKSISRVKRELSVIAAGWEQGKVVGTLSLCDWWTKDSILCLDSHPLGGGSLTNINRYLIDRLTRLRGESNDLNASHSKDTWMIVNCSSKGVLPPSVQSLISEEGRPHIRRVLSVSSLKEWQSAIKKEGTSQAPQLDHLIFLATTDQDELQKAAALFPSLSELEISRVLKSEKSDPKDIVGIGRTPKLSKPFKVHLLRSTISDQLLEPDIYAQGSESRTEIPLTKWDASDHLRLSLIKSPESPRKSPLQLVKRALKNKSG